MTYRDGNELAAGEFALATDGQRRQIEQLAELAKDGDRADRFAAGWALARLGAFAEATASNEAVAPEAPDDRRQDSCLAALGRRASAAKLVAVGHDGASLASLSKALAGISSGLAEVATCRRGRGAAADTDRGSWFGSLSTRFIP